METKSDGPAQVLVKVDGWDVRISTLYGSQSVCVHSATGILVLYVSTFCGVFACVGIDIQASYSGFDAPLGRYDAEQVPRLVEFATRGAPAELRALLGVQP